MSYSGGSPEACTGVGRKIKVIHWKRITVRKG